MEFKIEQIALCPPDPEAAKALLRDMGATEWAEDHVVASGEVFEGQDTNEADLSFNYTMLERARELEVLHYTAGPNWMQDKAPAISHLGSHCTAEELELWRAFFAERGIFPVQEVETQSHTNPVIKDKRQYKYVIFNTRPILGVDIKLIVRRYVSGV